MVLSPVLVLGKLFFHLSDSTRGNELTNNSLSLFMVGSLTAGQFAIYGDVKRMLGATGGVEIVK